MATSPGTAKPQGDGEELETTQEDHPTTPNAKDENSGNIHVSVTSQYPKDHASTRYKSHHGEWVPCAVELGFGVSGHGIYKTPIDSEANWARTVDFPDQEGGVERCDCACNYMERQPPTTGLIQCVHGICIITMSYI